MHEQYKEYEFNYPAYPELTKVIFGGAFTGIIIAVANLGYDFIYRGITHFSPSEIINVSSLIFGSLLAMMFLAVIYLMFAKMGKTGGILYRILILIITVAVLVTIVSTNKEQSTFGGMHGLLIGLTAISGFVGGFLLIPHFAKNHEIYI